MKTYLGLVSTLAATIFLTACGSSSSSSNNAASDPNTQIPEVTEPDATDPEIIEPVVGEPCGDQLQLLFPLSYSATLANSITVRGSSDCDTIDGITINGITATSSDDYANWQAQIALQPGPNTIAASIQEGEESHSLILGAVESNELFNSPEEMALTSDGSTLYIVDSSRRHIVKMNMATGQRSIVSSTDYPNQNLYFGNLGGLALNEAEGLLYIGSKYVDHVDAGTKAWVLTVDIESGERSVLVDPFSADYTPLIGVPNELVFDATNKKLYASEQGEIYSIELDESATVGEQTLISSSSVPDSVNPLSTNGNLSLELDSINQRLLVLDDGNSSSAESQLLSVDLNPGNLGARTVISDATSNGASWDRPSSLVQVDSDYVYITDMRSSDLDDIDIIKIELSNGYRSIVHNGSIGAGKQLLSTSSMIFDSTNQQLLISNIKSNGLFSLSLSDYQQSMIAYNLNPEIAGLDNLDDLKRSALDIENQKLYYQVEDKDISVLDLKTLEHQAFSTVVSDEYAYSAIDSMSFDSVSNAIVVTGEFDENAHVRSYAIVDGSETIISDDTTGTGDDLNEIWDWVRLNDTTAIIADDTTSPTQYYELDMTTGNRVLIAVDYSGMPSNLEAEDIALSADKNTLYIVDDSSNAGLYALDLTSKTFTTITDSTLPTDGNDLRLNDPESLELSSDGLYAYVGENSAAYLIKVNLATGAREGFMGDVITTTNSWAERINGISVDTESQVLYTTDTSTDAIMMMDEVTNEWVMIAE